MALKNRRLLPLALCGALCAPLLLTPRPARADVTEPSSGTAYQETRTVGGKTYQFLGTGLRKKFVIKVYAIGLYVEQAGAKAAYASGAGAGPQSFVINGSFGKLAALRFLRDVDKGKIQEAYRDSLEGALSDKAPSELSRDANAFVALFDKDVREGQELRIATDEAGKITVEIAGQKKEGPQNPQLARAIWEIWLGQKSILGGGRKGLVDRIDTLGR